MKPYNVKVTSAFVKATAYCSCGTMSYGYHTSTFENYCPRCKSYGTLKFNPKGSPRENGLVVNVMQTTVQPVVKKKNQIPLTI